MAGSADLLTSPGTYNAAPAFADKAMTLLDFNQKLDIALLDSVVACFYSSTGAEVRWQKHGCSFPFAVMLEFCS